MLPTILLMFGAALVSAAVWMVVHVVVFGCGLAVTLWKVVVWWPPRWGWRQ